MQKQFSIIIVLMFMIINVMAQNIKGLYVDGFATILGNTAKEDSLLYFAKNNGFNYLTLYQMHLVNANTPLNNAAACTTFSNFVNKAKTQFNILQIGVAGENYNFFENNLHPYNQQHAFNSEKIDVYNVEFEFWVPAYISPGGVYCVDYLSNAGYTCDSAGAFTYYQKMLHKIDSLANADGAISETYFGWFSATEGTQIVQTGVDRILLSAYIPSANYSASYQFNYLQNRLANLGNNNSIIKVLPIYSAEPSFMQTWANSNPFFTPYFNLQNSLLPLSFGWMANIQLEGIQWFAYSDMPKINMSLETKNILLNNNEIFPNPSTNYICITGDVKNSVVTISDYLGRNVYQKSTMNNIEKIDLQKLPSGSYILNLRSKNESFDKLFIKK